MIQKIPLEVLNVLRHAVERLSIFAKMEENKEYRRMWLRVFDLIDSKRKGILQDQADRELAKTNKKMAQQNVQRSTNEDIEAGAPEYRPPSDNANTKAPVSKPLNRRKENEKNQINGAKTKKGK
jgi:hypothetical protein